MLVGHAQQLIPVVKTPSWKGCQGDENRCYEASPQYDPASVSFSCNNAVSVGVPNTVVFSYDVSEVKADSFFIPLVVKGCIGNISVKLGEVIKNGQTNDLSAFGRNVYEWQLLKVSVQDQLARITLNDRLIYEAPFQQDIGAIVGFRLLFSGTGAIDYLQLSTPVNDEVIYRADFDA